ncbi:MAG TPA: poly(3-hydroxybutyrate) depolymerase [Hyphomicrobiaceae bacterium]|nr:poly(3-hydroxybutyrate) depolymerase [Hyphomicrobiaceae bacterium]
MIVRPKLGSALGLAAALLGLVAAACDAPSPRGRTSGLPNLGAAPDQTTVSGISSGAYMAGQIQIAHSSRMLGAAIIAGGPFGCAESPYAVLVPGGSLMMNATRAINTCMKGLAGKPDAEPLVERVRRLAARGEIDPVATLALHRLYVFSGTRDEVVVPRVAAAVPDLYERLGMPVERMKRVTTMAAGHAFVTENNGLSCSATGKPYIVGCGYDQAGDLLAHLYGHMRPPSTARTGTLSVFEQSPFTRDLPFNAGMAISGAIYVPKDCADRAGCRIHVAFHGCGQSRLAVGDAFIRETGFLRWSDTNRLIILFPQAAPSATNPQGCWDWWGYTGRDFLTQKAPQIRAVMRMIDRLSEPAGR